MAVKLNKRKRKYAETEESQVDGEERVDDGELAVPRKIAKESQQTPNQKKKLKQRQNESKEENDDTLVNEETPSKKSKKKKPHQEDLHKKLEEQQQQVVSDVQDECPLEMETPSKKSKKKNKNQTIIEQESEEQQQVAFDEDLGTESRSKKSKKKKLKQHLNEPQADEEQQKQLVFEEEQMDIETKDSPTKKSQKKKKIKQQTEQEEDEEKEATATSSNKKHKKTNQTENNQQIKTPGKKEKRKREKNKKINQESTGEQHDDDNISPDSGIEPGQEEPAIKFSKDFKMLHFRTRLRGTNFITELRHFLHMYNTTRPRIVAKYIEKRGKPLELAEALERIDKTNIHHVGYLCEALQLVILEIVTNQRQLMESAVYASRYFLKVQNACIDQLLKSPQHKHRRIALKLLTAIVCVEPQLGRQILSSYDILSNVNKVESMLSHSQVDKDTGTESVRKSFIHFVMAFLVDGNTLLIRNILDRSHLVRVLIKGLFYDDHVTVCIVLNTLRKYVVECAEISKTKKIHVFDLECCKNLTRLYNWQGPRSLDAHYGGKRLTAKSAMEYTTPEARDAVSSAVHELLLILLTSRKYGITFDAITHYRQKHNTIQGKLMGSLNRPYVDPRKTDLVIKVLQACPDLARHTVRNFANVLNPLHNKEHIVEATDFLTQLIEAVPPNLLAGAMEKMTLTDLTYWLKEVTLPLEALTQIRTSNNLRNVKFHVRYSTTRLLVAMLTQYSNYITAITKREQAKRAQNSLRRFKFDMLNHLLLNFPTIEGILYALYMSIQQQHEDDVDVLQHLSVTLDLLLIICKENRSFIHKTSQILDYLEVLRPLYETNFSQESEAKKALLTKTELNNAKLELKAIKTILVLFPRALQPSEDLFEKVLRSFVKAFVNSDPEVQDEAGTMLHSLFKNTGIFDQCSYEIDLWLEALRCFNPNTVEHVTSILVQIFKNKDAEVEMPALMTAEHLTNLHRLFEHIEKGLTVKAYVETPMISKFLPLLFKGVEIDKPYDEYIEVVCLLLFHYFPTPSYIHQIYTKHLQNLTPYMESWLTIRTDQNEEEKEKDEDEDKDKEKDVSNRKSCQPVKGTIATRIEHLKELRKAILGGKQKFELTYAKASNEDYFEMEFDGKLQQLHSALKNHRLIQIYIQQIFFIVAQLLQLERLNESQADLAADYLIKLIEITKKLSADKEIKTVDEEESETELSRILYYIYSLRLNYARSTEVFGVLDKSQLHYIRFLRILTDYCKDLPQFDKYAENYRNKIIKAVSISLLDVEQTKKNSVKLMECVKLIDAFKLSTENCVEVLGLLTEKLKWNDLIKFTKPTIYYDLLICVLRRLTELQQPISCVEQVKQIEKYYIKFNKQIAEGEELQLEQFEVALHDFLITYHQHIQHFGCKFFKCLLTTRKLNKSTIKLACLLLERNIKELGTTFIELLPENIEKRELIYPLLSMALKRRLTLDTQLLQTAYQAFKTGFMRSIEKPLKAAIIFKEHSNCSVSLIKHCMPKSECLDFCKKTLKIDSVELYQMPLIQAIYQTALVASKEAGGQESASIFTNFINLQVQLLCLELKKQDISLEKLELFAWYCFDWWSSNANDVELLASADFSKLLSGHQWMNFCKSSLKLGMHISESTIEAEQLEQVDQTNGLLLKLLAFLCDKLYKDYNEEEDQDHKNGGDQSAAQLFEMICTHSCFFSIIHTNNVRPSLVKTSVMQMLYTLAKKAPQALLPDQIPIILGAYHARLTSADQYALALLELFERFDVGLKKYIPLIWGESAVAFYALRANDDDRAKLQQQDTSINQVMSLIDKQVCLYTIDNFPIWRSLHSCEQLPDVSFIQPELKSRTFGSNSLEKRIELGVTKFSKNDLRLCPKRESIYAQCYDPAFFVPLMLHCFAPENYTHAARPVQNGLLSLVFTALSSQDKDMRLAAACCQQRYRAQFEQAKFFEKPWWLQTYDNIHAGLSDLRDFWMKHKRNSGTPRVPLIPTLFIAKTFNLTTEPTHLLYKQLTMYLHLKKSFNFQVIPEFNILFYSPEVEHHEFRNFIVEVIRNGIKCSADLFQLVTTHTFKVLMGFYGGPMSTLDTNLQILSIMSTCVKIPGSVEIMFETLGITSWLSGVIVNTEFYQFDVIEGLISILNNLWYALKATEKDFYNFDYLQRTIYRLLLQLQPILSPRISVANFAKYLNILQKSVLDQHIGMKEAQMDQLLDCVAKYFPNHLAPIRCIRQFGGSGAETHADYCKYLAEALEQDKSLDKSMVLALSSLRLFVINWWQVRFAQEVDDVPKAEVEKNEVPKAEVEKNDSPKAEVEKNEVPKDENARDEVPQDDDIPMDEVPEEEEKTLTES